jgi:VWFA-related protein
MVPAVPSNVRSSLAALVALLLGVWPAAAQDKPPETRRKQGGVVATEEVQVLTLDVLALDKKGRPVFGLAAADFEVKVAGKVQTIEFFEPPGEPAVRATGASKEGRPDSEERIAGTTTPFEAKAATRHVLFYVDLEQLPKRTVYESANAIRTAMEHPAAGRYSLAANFGRVSSRVWDSDAPDAILAEADALAADASSGESAASRVSTSGHESGVAAPVPSVAPSSYEDRAFLEKTLIDDLVAAEEAKADTRWQVQAIVEYLGAERRRVKASVENLRETAERLAALEGPRHLVLLSEGLERMPGFNFLSRLRAEEEARLKSQAGGVGKSLGTATPPWAPGADRAVGGGRFGFGANPLPEVDDLARWLAASGVIVHYLDPSPLGKDLTSAEDRFAFESGQRSEEAKNLQDTPLRYASETGGVTRLHTNDLSAALSDLLDATSSSYRIGMRLQGVDPKKTYSVKVTTRKAGLNVLARTAFKPASTARQTAAALFSEARRADSASRVDERRPGVARLARKPLPVVLEWKGLSTLRSTDPLKPFWKLDVKIPHEALTFRPEEDALLASVQIAVEAIALDGPLRDSFTDDWLLSYSGPEYKEVRDQEAVRTVTLQLPPGRWELNVSVRDALGEASGFATVRVEASR